MRRHLSSPRVQPPPACQIRQNRHWRITLALAILTGICIGVSLRSIREEKASRERAVEAPEAVFRGADPEMKPDAGLDLPVQQERAKYATFEEAMGLRDTKAGPKFIW